MWQVRRHAQFWRPVTIERLAACLTEGVPVRLVDYRGEGYINNIASRAFCSRTSDDSSGFSNTDDFNTINKKHKGLSLTEELDKKIQSGVWRSDPIQRRAAKKLERLQNVLDGYSHKAVFQYLAALEEREAVRKEEENKQKDHASQKNKRGDVNSVDSGSADEAQLPEPPLIPRGFYLHGSVGAGKSMLMDFFFDHARVEKKQRYHFHEFMAMVHQMIHILKQKQLQTFGRSFSIDINPRNNPIRNVAIQLAKETSLLCLDEFQVTDVADAMILKQLFSTLWSMGTVVVTTSNRLPSELYENGLNRTYFLPFIDQLESHCVVHTMSSSIDYRIVLATDDERLDGFFFDKSNAAQNHQFHDLVERLRKETKVVPVTIDIGFNRQLLVEQGDDDGRFAQFQFEELCDVELGASDYRAIARQFDIVSIQDIPTMTLGDPNRARRFVTLIDELYEDKSTALICQAANQNDPFELFLGRRQPVDNDTPGSQQDANFDATALGIDQAKKDDQPLGALASIHELSFAFQRAGSRIVEMTSRRWWDQVLGQK